uniref:CBFD_NFYB_HMF domain-containing protein n=1 Tax=Strongyloides stercoralis TaxID=6248 RepID=A0A0K0EJV5_STRER
MEESTINDNSNKVVKQKVTGQQTIFPLARVKKIIKHIPNVTLIAPEVITATSYVTERFIEILAEECFRNAGAGGRKTVTRKDIDAVIESSLPFQILENCIDDLEEVGKINTIQDVFEDEKEDNDDDVVDPDGNNDIVLLEEVSNSDSLHIGVINKRNGIVYSFWNNGINKEGASIEWIGCVETFNLIETNKSKNMDNFLLLCGSFFENNMYDCNTWNCFDFVLAFLNYYGYPIRFLSKEVFIRKMAEFLESDDNNDNDRLMDRKSFNREQFRLFKEAFRDFVEVEESVEYDDNVNVFDYVSSGCKKKIINLIIKLEKLEKSTNDEVVREKASDFLKQLRESVSLESTAGEELSQDDINLKNFDEVDINLFLGEEFEEKNGKNLVLEALSNYREKCLHELEVLLKESECFLKLNKNK